MPRRPLAIAFDVDETSLLNLRSALPGWRIDEMNGSTIASLPCSWQPGDVELLIVGFGDDPVQALALCRFLTFYSEHSRDRGLEPGELSGALQNDERRMDAPLLVLVAPGQEDFIDKALASGAHTCLVCPINAKEVASMLVRTRAGNQPGRHTSNFESAQTEDRWRDAGGEA